MGRPLKKKNFGERADAGYQFAPAAYTNDLYGDAHIVKQKGSKRFLVATTGQVNQICTLQTTTPTASGEMVIKCKDSDTRTYFVKKISSRVAVLVADTGVQFADGQKVRWNTTGAVANESVIIDVA